MTKKQRCDCTIMPRTATQESQKSGFWRKLCGIWSGIGGNKQYPYVVTKPNLFEQIKRIILHLRLWMWAATKSNLFQHLEISFTKVIDFKIYSPTYSTAYVVIEIGLHKPRLYYIFSPSLARGFCKKHNLPLDTFEHNETPL